MRIHQLLSIVLALVALTSCGETQAIREAASSAPTAEKLAEDLKASNKDLDEQRRIAQAELIEAKTKLKAIDAEHKRRERETISNLLLWVEIACGAIFFISMVAFFVPLLAPFRGVLSTIAIASASGLLLAFIIRSAIPWLPWIAGISVVIGLGLAIAAWRDRIANLLRNNNHNE